MAQHALGQPDMLRVLTAQCLNRSFVPRDAQWGLCTIACGTAVLQDRMAAKGGAAELVTAADVAIGADTDAACVSRVVEALTMQVGAP